MSILRHLQRRQTVRGKRPTRGVFTKYHIVGEEPQLLPVRREPDIRNRGKCCVLVEFLGFYVIQESFPSAAEDKLGTITGQCQGFLASLSLDLRNLLPSGTISTACHLSRFGVPTDELTPICREYGVVGDLDVPNAHVHVGRLLPDTRRVVEDRNDATEPPYSGDVFPVHGVYDQMLSILTKRLCPIEGWCTDTFFYTQQLNAPRTPSQYRGRIGRERKLIEWQSRFEDTPGRIAVGCILPNVNLALLQRATREEAPVWREAPRRSIEWLGRFDV